jgi:hypothetical protein
MLSLESVKFWKESIYHFNLIIHQVAALLIPLYLSKLKSQYKSFDWIQCFLYNWSE